METIKRIANKSWTLWNDYYKEGDRSSLDILDELESDIQELVYGKWKNVKDELPAKKGFYLVVVDQSVASKNRGPVEILDCYETVDSNMRPCLKFQDYVTHWMEIPHGATTTQNT